MSEKTTTPGDATLKNETAEAALEALVRYLAQRPAETVRAIARLVKLLPSGRQARVFAHTRGLYDVLVQFADVRLVNVPERSPRGALHGCTAIVDGIEFEALYRVTVEDDADPCHACSRVLGKDARTTGAAETVTLCGPCYRQGEQEAAALDALADDMNNDERQVDADRGAL